MTQQITIGNYRAYLKGLAKLTNNTDLLEYANKVKYTQLKARFAAKFML